MRVIMFTLYLFLLHHILITMKTQLLLIVALISPLDSVVKLLQIYCDDFAVIFFFKNKYFGGIKHMDLKYLAVKVQIQSVNWTCKH